MYLDSQVIHIELYKVVKVGNNAKLVHSSHPHIDTVYLLYKPVLLDKNLLTPLLLLELHEQGIDDKIHQHNDKE